MEKTSGMWNYFDKLKRDGEAYGRCKDDECIGNTNTNYYVHIPSGGTTSNMWRHLKQFHPETYKKEKTILDEKNAEKKLREAEEHEKQEYLFSIQPKVTESFPKVSAYSSNHPNQKRFHRNVKDMMVLDALPFKISNSPQFRKLVKDMDPRIRVADRKTYSRSIRKEGKIVKQRSRKHVRDFVAGGYSATADCWKSKGKDSYMGINSVFICKDWKLHKITTSCKVFNEEHSGENIRNLLERESNSLDLPETTSKFNVTDTASDIVCGRRFGGYCNFSCCNHKLQLCLDDADKQPQNAGALDSVAAARSLVTFASHSGPFHKKMKRFCRKKKHRFTKLHPDVKTRWNSKYHMIQRVMAHRSCIQEMELTGAAPRKMPVLEVADWRNLGKLEKILKPLDKVTKVWESESQPTMSSVGEEVFNLTQDLKDILDEAEDEMTTRYARSLLESLERRFPQWGMESDPAAWGNLLNPRLKGLLLTEQGIYQETVDRLQAWIETKPDIDSSDNKSATPEVRTEEEPGNKLTPMEKLKKKRFGNTSDFVNTVEMDLKKELAIYHQLPEPTKGQNILQFWKENCSVLPLLSAAARIVLGIPCASSNIERTFRLSGLFVTNLRTCTDPELVEGMVIRKSNSGKVNFKDIETEELDESTSDNTGISEDSEEDEDVELQTIDPPPKLVATSTSAGEGGPSRTFEMQGSISTPRMPRRGRRGRGGRGRRSRGARRGNLGERGGTAGARVGTTEPLNTSPRGSSTVNVSPGASVSNWLETDREEPPQKKRQNNGSQSITSFFRKNPRDCEVTYPGNLGLRLKKRQPCGFLDQSDEEEDMDENENEVGDDADEP